MRTAILFCFTLSFSYLFGQNKDIPYVILVSFDGYRYDYVQKFKPPHFEDFITRGAQAKALIPSFPSKTFPNHYTLVTGLYPGHHGLVDNTFYDPARQVTYSMSKKERVTDPWFYGGTPIWTLCSDHGIKSAAYFWVGSEVPTRRPDYMEPYNPAIPDTARVDHVLRWLSLPEDKRPHLITLYFSSPDDEGHLHGPTSDETKAAVINADNLLARLMKGLARVSLNANVIIVSDHGMQALKRDEHSYIFLNELMDMKNPLIKVSNGGTQTHIYLSNPAKRDSLQAVLTKKAVNYSVYNQEQFPSRWVYKSTRSGDLLITAHEGYYFREGDRASLTTVAKNQSWSGVHGYDATQVKDMQGIFYAAGPNIRQGVIVESFENIHVYPLIARILGLPLPAIDGRAEVLEKIYKP